MTEYSYPDLYQNRPVIVLAFYFTQQGVSLNKGLVDLSAKLADWLNIQWHKFVVAFKDENLPIRNYYEYKRTPRRWSDLISLMEAEELETFDLNSYRTGCGQEECLVTLSVDFRSVSDNPHVCYLHVVPDVADSERVEQVNGWLLPLVTQVADLLAPLYGFVHVGDWGLNWYLYANGTEDASFPVEGSEDLEVFRSIDILRTQVPRVYWGNLLSAEHIKRLENVDELRAWEPGSHEWAVYHNAVLNEEFRQRKGIPPDKPGTRTDWPVQVHELEEGYVFFTLTPDPLDWSPNVGILGLIKPEFWRITSLFKARNMTH